MLNSDMQFALEPYSSLLIEEMMPLWKSHHEEIASNNYGPLDPDLRVYRHAAESKGLRIFTVRDNTHSLHGYQVFFVNFHPHSRGSLQAVQDILYLCKTHRLGLEGYRFIRWCVGQLKAEGVQMVHQHISARHDFGKVLERMGFELEDLVYSKRLSEVA